MVEAVVIVPGIMGSQLYQDQSLIWPGTPAELLLPYAKMDQLLDPGLQVGDIIRSVSLSSQYDSLIDAMERCGFREKDTKPTLAICPYDWRKDNRFAADRLAKQVMALRQDHGVDLTINLVAHSMGGLVSRYFLESRIFNESNCPGFAQVRRLITIGTPHRGAPLALSAALGQIKRLFLNAAQVKQIADRDEFPALYQLMPPASEPFLWNTSPGARLQATNPYQPEVAKALGLNPSNLKSAASFHAALDLTKKPEGVAYFCFVGTRQGTISNAQGKFDGGGARQPVGVEIVDGGDGTVPSWSASLAGMQQLAVGGEHGGLYKVPEVLRTLGALLGKQGVLSSAINPNLIRLSVRDDVVEPETKEPVVLIFNMASGNLVADLVVRKLAGSDGQALASPQSVAKHSVSYQGVPIDSLALTITAPQYAGIYELDLQRDSASIAENNPKLIVQRS